MPRLVDRNATSLIMTLRLADVADDPITGVLFGDADLEVAWLNSASTDWTAVTLVAGTIGTYTANGWIEVGDGVYQLGLPNGAIAAGDRTQIRVTYAANPPQYDSVDAVIYTPDEIAEDVATQLTGIRLTLQDQLAVSGALDLHVIQGDDYTNNGVQIDIDTSSMSDPMVDLSTKYLIVAIESTPVIALRMPIVGSPGSHYALFDPPSSATELWPTGRFNLLYRIQWGVNQYQTLDSEATMTIDPFDIDEADIVDI